MTVEGARPIQKDNTRRGGCLDALVIFATSGKYGVETSLVLPNGLELPIQSSDDVNNDLKTVIVFDGFLADSIVPSTRRRIIRTPKVI